MKIRLREHVEEDNHMMVGLKDDVDLQVNLFGPGSLDPELIINHIHITVADAETDQALGFVQLININREDGTATAGACIAPPHQRHGYGTEALRELHRYAHDVMGLRRLRVKILARNKAALSMCRKLGYQKTGSRECWGLGKLWELVTMEKALP